MSQIIHDLATINVSDDIVRNLDLGGIYQSFSKNYKKLDDLKNFRAEHEKRNALMRWWHNDKLRDAQLDSSEVQAEFSKTIGQLMMISIVQSKELTQQQGQLNEQQGMLKKQADGIAEQAGMLQQQHKVLAQQSADLEKLVTDYFALKGLTEQGAQRLIEIAAEVKATKQNMLDEFTDRARMVDSVCSKVSEDIDELRSSISMQISESTRQAQAATLSVQMEMHERIEKIDSSMLDGIESLRGLFERNLVSAGQRLDLLATQVKAGYDTLSENLSNASKDAEQRLTIQGDRITAVEDKASDLSVQLTNSGQKLSQMNDELGQAVRRQQKFNDDQSRSQLEMGAKLQQTNRITKVLSVSALGLFSGLGYVLVTILGRSH